MNILDLLIGKPILTTDERAEQIGPVQGIPIFGLDALSSAAYGPEAALSLLIPLGLAESVHYIIYPSSQSHHHAACDRLFFVSADDSGVSERWRIVYRRAR